MKTATIKKTQVKSTTQDHKTKLSHQTKTPLNYSKHEFIQIKDGKLKKLFNSIGGTNGENIVLG